MKKATLLFETGEAETAVKNLRTLGVLQVEHQNPPEGRDISALREKVALINSSFDVLNQVMASGNVIQPQKKITGDWITVAGTIVDLGKRREQLESSHETILGQIKEWERWGDVDADQIRHLAQNGVYLKLYQVPVKEITNYPDDVVVRTIFTTGAIAHCVAISRRQFECPFEEILPPKQSLSLLKSRLSGNTHDIESIKSEIIESTCFYEDLSEILEKTRKRDRIPAGIAWYEQGRSNQLCHRIHPF